MRIRMHDRSPAGRLRESLPFLVDTAAKLRPWVPIAVRHRIWQRRTLRAFPELSPASLHELVAAIAASVDLARLRRLHREHRTGTAELVELYDYERKLEVAAVKALLAGVHERPRLRILDLGCGGGYFVATCRYLGHACHGTEVPPSRMSLATAAAYAEVTSALRIGPTIQLLISACAPLALPAMPSSYDLITAHKICFNDHMRAHPWSVPQWQFFITDARRYLAPGGRLVLELNENVARYGARRWYDAELASYFGTVGRVVRNRITIE
jgi:SAM-dependent methyltransferase